MAYEEQEDAAWRKSLALSNDGARTTGVMKRIQLVGQRGSRDFPLD
jgi:hypothetical protein